MAVQKLKITGYVFSTKALNNLGLFAIIRNILFRIRGLLSCDAL